MDMDTEALRALELLKSTSPTSFLIPNSSLSKTAKNASQGLFSCASKFVKYEGKSTSTLNNSQLLPKLYVEGFDSEQIWVQIETQTIPIISHFKKCVLKPLDVLLTKPSDAFLKDKPTKIESKKKKNELISKENLQSKQTGNENKEEEELDERDEEDNDESQGDEFDEVNEENENEHENGDAGVKNSKIKTKTSIEDQFFKFEDMEKFLEDAEAQDIKKSSYFSELYSSGDVLIGDEEEEGEGEEDEGNLFNQDEEEDKDEGDIMKLSGDNMKYKDFFKDGHEKIAEKKSNKNKIDENDDEDELNDGDDDDDDENDDMDFDSKNKSLFDVLKEEKNEKKDEKLSTHEKDVENIKNKIERLEKFNLGDKPWVLEGEVTAKKRPKNSALEVELDFEHSMKPPPVITPELTLSVEDMIKNRILEGKFDDVRRKKMVVQVAPDETIEIDETQSQRGLAEIYEAEYLKSMGEIPEIKNENDRLKDEASLLFKELCTKLDALSHFHFSPKPVIEDLNVKVNVPAIAMEETVPVAISDASLLAPEEIFKSNAVMTPGESTREENRRNRRKVKRKIRAELHAKDPLKLRTNVSSAKNNIIENNKVDDYTNSTKMFARMQEVKDNPRKRKIKEDANQNKTLRNVSFKL